MGIVGKTVVLGMLQRGGQVMTKIVESNKKHVLQPVIEANVVKGSNIHTDTLRPYQDLTKAGYNHRAVSHTTGEYVRGNCHVNGMENFWKHLKGSINGTRMQVSRKHLAKYAKEFEFRFNRREEPASMFPSLVSSYPQP